MQELFYIKKASKMRIIIVPIGKKMGILNKNAINSDIYIE
jgi:hypothetical protein